MKKPKGLGQGLDALLGDPDDVPGKPAPESAAEPGDRVRQLPLAAIRQGRYQPRSHFDHDALQTLADSIREHGVMQPILVRRLAADADNGAATFEILAGERRYRAAERAGLTEVPVIEREMDDEQALAVALIENIQREDLNPIEEALAIRRLIEEFAYSHDAAAKAIGRSRSATSNLLRLLNLAEPVQQMVMLGQLDMGHARALLTLERADQVLVAKQVESGQLSVRETEALVARQLANETVSGREPAPRPRRLVEDPDLVRLQQRLSDILTSTVQIRPDAKGGGKLMIRFSDSEQFEGLLQTLGLRKRLDQDD
ncbi:MAG: ParB/RepB/Spo0J family partition protein [Burkholderiaceae bacterium]